MTRTWIHSQTQPHRLSWFVLTLPGYSN
jgi:hypothetical protein